MTDYEFDALCKDALVRYDSLEHPHKHLITKEMLIAGTGYNLAANDYPMIVEHAANLMIQENRN